MSEHQKSSQNGYCNQVNEISPALEKQSHIDDGRNLSGVNLSGANLVGKDFAYENLSEADLSGANLR